MIRFPDITEKYPPTTRAAVDELERSVGVVLPRLYKEFLMVTNGGRPKQSAFPISGLSNNPFGSIQVFLGLGAPFEMSDLSRHNALYKGGFPQGIVVIATTGGPSPVIFDLRDGQQRVLYFDFVHYWSTGEWRESDLYLIANSFDEFLSSLREDRSAS